VFIRPRLLTGEKRFLPRKQRRARIDELFSDYFKYGQAHRYRELMAAF
jgi:hypothetical protein